MAVDQFDVIIVGSGPIGLACGIQAGEAGFSHLIIEKGCLVNSIYNYPLYMTFFSTPDTLEIGGVPFVAHGVKPTRPEALEYYRRVAMKFDLNINFYEEVKDIKKEKDHFWVESDKSNYESKAVIIATGFYDTPNKLNVKGEELDKVRHYYSEAHPYFQQKIIVIGAANSAVDVALECYRKGAEVTMVMLEEKIGDNVKYWVKPDIENRIKEGSIKAYFESHLLEIRDEEADIMTLAGKVTVKNDFVLAMTGYVPDFSFLKQIGVNIREDESCTPEYSSETMETNIPNLYLAGVVCGGFDTSKWFIENSRKHADLIIRDLASK